MPTPRFATISLLALGFMGWVAVPARAVDWPIFRGPRHNGISYERHWGEDWANCSFKVKWTQSVGLGASSVAVADGRLYTMGNGKILNKDSDTVYCLDASSGAPIWTYSYTAILYPSSYEGGTNTTPTVVGDRVYTLGKQGQAFCFDAETGAVLWQVDLVARYKVNPPGWYFAGSPYPYGDLVIYNAGKHGLALHASDGTLAWMTGTETSGYSTPVPFDHNGRHLLVVGGEKTLAAVEPLTGTVAWEYPWVTSLPANIADPVVDGNDLFVSSGYNKGSALVRVSGNKVTQVWFQQKNMQTTYNTAVLWQGYLYGPNERGPNLTCLEFSTGNVMWNQPMSGHCGVALADGRLIILSYGGELSIAKASPAGYTPDVKSQVLATGSLCRTAPVLANGKIYVRSSKPGTLACVELETTGPKVQAGGSIITWLKAGSATVDLNGSVVDDTGDVTTIRWSVMASPPGSTVHMANPSVAATTVTLDRTGVYVMELYAIDAMAQEGTDRIEVRVYADTCEAARNVPPGASVSPWPGWATDCVEAFDDFAVFAATWPGARGFSHLALFAAQWLKDLSLTTDVLYDAGRISLPVIQPVDPF